MRRVAYVALALLALAPAVAGSASIDPRQLVLKLNDLPTGFSIDRKQTGPRFNAVVARETSSTLPQLLRWGRVGGYQATFTRGRR